MTGADDPGLTRSTLLERVRLQQSVAWDQLVELYGPLVYTWCRRAQCQPGDAADLVQEVFTAVAVSLERLRRDRPGDSFRAWLRTITRNKVVDHFRSQRKNPVARGGTDACEQIQQIPEPLFPDEESAADQDADRAELLSRALQMVKGDFEETTWQAFWLSAVDGQTTASIAKKLQMQKNAVRQAKFRVMRRMRDEFGELLE